MTVTTVFLFLVIRTDRSVQCRERLLMVRNVGTLSKYHD